MTRYLILPDADAAEARSRAAWTPGADDTITVRMWSIFPLPEDGRAALLIPEETVELLTAEERAALVGTLPGPAETDGDAAG